MACRGAAAVGAGGLVADPLPPSGGRATGRCSSGPGGRRPIGDCRAPCPRHGRSTTAGINVVGWILMAGDQGDPSAANSQPAQRKRVRPMAGVAVMPGQGGFRQGAVECPRGEPDRAQLAWITSCQRGQRALIRALGFGGHGANRPFFPAPQCVVDCHAPQQIRRQTANRCARAARWMTLSHSSRAERDAFWVEPLRPSSFSRSLASGRTPSHWKGRVGLGHEAASTPSETAPDLGWRPERESTGRWLASMSSWFRGQTAIKRFMPLNPPSLRIAADREDLLALQLFC